MTHLFQFGEAVEGYDIPVLNERAVRAAAGILFFFAIVPTNGSCTTIAGDGAPRQTLSQYIRQW